MSLNEVRFVLSETSFPSNLSRRTRLSGGAAMYSALSRLQSCRDEECLGAAIALFGQSLAEVQAIDGYATAIEHDMEWGKVSRTSLDKVMSLGSAMDALIAALKALNLEEVVEKLAAGSKNSEILCDVAAAAEGFPKLLGLYVNLGRTTMVWFTRTEELIRELEKIRVRAQ